MFKNKHDFDERKKIYASVIKENENRVPVIIEPFMNLYPHLTKKKYLIPHLMKFNDFISIINKRLNLNKNQCLLVTINNTMITNSDVTIEQIYNLYKDTDGFLYVNYSIEPAFG